MASPTLPLFPETGRVLVCRGARAAEERLLRRLAQLAAEAAADPRLLSRPVLVVVPSGSLRDHLAAALARRLGAALGVEIQTLFALAAAVLERSGERAPRGALALEVLARRHARAMPGLARALGDLADGFGAAVATVRDLLDAGFTPAHLEAVEDQVASLGRAGQVSGSQADRAVELARVAAGAAEEMSSWEAGSPADAYAGAAQLLAADPGLLPARAVLVHGFAEATGLALDLLEALGRHAGAEVYLDLPPDPAAPGAGPLAFADRLARRLGGWPAAELLRRSGEETAAEPPSLALFAAPGPHSEAREVALRVRSLLDAGARPEGVGVVARDLGPYRLALAQAFSRLGVPFSALGEAGSPGAGERRLAALVELLSAGKDTPAERWLAALWPGRLEGEEAGGAAHLALGLKAMGAGRLAEVAGLDLGAVLLGDGLPLPVRRGGDAGEGEGGEPAGPAGTGAPVEGEPARLVRRYLPRRVLERAVGAARRLVRHLEGWQEAGAAGRPAGSRASGPRGRAGLPLSDHLGRARSLLGEHLGWPREEAAGGFAWTVLATLAEELPGDPLLTAEELGLLFRRQAQRLSEQRVTRREAAGLGGRGGGAQVLTAVEARGRTWDHLFVVGLSRDLFPRRVEEDPLLADRLRAPLRQLLPDLPVKAEGHLEEPYLFAQLLASAPALTLSWSATDDDGEPLAASPFIDRLRLARPDLGEPAAAPHLHAPPAAGTGPFLAWEHALWAGLAAGRGAFERLLPVALGEALGSTLPAPHLATLARVRAAVLAEVDPDLSSPEGRLAGSRPGPFLGLVGPLPVASELWITRIESLARCSWQALLERVLGLERAPDPLAALATVDAVLVGRVVHAVFERLVAEAGGGTGQDLAEAFAAPAVAVAWPPPPRLAGIVGEVAAAVARQEGVPLLARALAARARELLEVGARQGFGDGFIARGAEVRGAVSVAGATGAPRRVRFRADLAEQTLEGLRLTDLKSGRPLTDARRPDTRRRKLLEAVERGDRLQAVAYALADLPAAAGGDAVSGRYLYLGRPEEDLPERSFEVARGESDFRQGFEAALGVLLEAWDRGSFLPRLLDETLEKEGGACRFCEVVEACPQRDSGATRRLARWVEAGREGARSAPLAAAALAAFRLRDRREREEEG